MIQVQGVTKRYGTTTAVRNVSFDVQRGEIVGFLGPNGAGKTTTMRILTGFLPPTEGTARVGGFDVLENPLEVKKRIGYLPETPPVYPEMDVDSYLRFVARIKGVPAREVSARVEAAMARTAVAHVRSRLIGKLSKGYRQRVGLAQALIHNPDVLILDEPTAGLDPKQIREVRELIQSLAADHTVILSTHILSEVAETCNRVIIINEGRIEASDTPQNLTTRLQSGQAIELEIGGPVEQISMQLQAAPGVHQVVHKGAVGDHSLWTIEADRGVDLRSDLARTVVNAGWSLYGLRSAGLSLEEVFLKLTASEQPPPPPAVPVEEETTSAAEGKEG